MAGLTHWVWLATLPHLSPRKAARLLEELGTPLEIYNASPEQLAEVSTITPADIAALGDKSLKRALRIVEDCARLGQQIVTAGDACYPELLRAIDDPPAVLFCRGKLAALECRPAVAVVGPREPTRYGYQTAKTLAYRMAQAGVTIVSGMARGIDAAAHAAALEAGKPTVAVLGCGLDICYPRENAALFNDIPKTGVLVSEYPPGTPPLHTNFPARNRIISGLCTAVLVPEASKRSGSLITASCALEQGRDVFAVPGNIDTPTSEGSNLLLKDGAHLVTCADDILSELAVLYPGLVAESVAAEPALAPEDDRYLAGPIPADKAAEEEKPFPEVTLVQAADTATPIGDRLCALLRGGPRHIDALVEAVPETTGDVIAALTMLELEGKVRQLPGKIYTNT